MCLIKPYHSSFLSISLDCECSFTARKRWSIKQKSVKIHRIRKRDVFIFNESFLHTRATTHLHNPYMRLIFYPSNSIPFLISPLYSLFSIFAFLLCGYWMSLCCCCFFYSIHSFICVSRDLLFGILRLCVFVSILNNDFSFWMACCFLLLLVGWLVLLWFINRTLFKSHEIFFWPQYLYWIWLPDCYLCGNGKNERV